MQQTEVDREVNFGYVLVNNIVGKASKRLFFKNQDDFCLILPYPL